MKNILVPLNLSTIEKTRIRHKIMDIVRNKCESGTIFWYKIYLFVQ